MFNIGDSVTDLTAKANDWEDVYGKIISIDGPNIKVRYSSGYERWKLCVNLAHRKKWRKKMKEDIQKVYEIDVIHAKDFEIEEVTSEEESRHRVARAIRPLLVRVPEYLVWEEDRHLLLLRQSPGDSNVFIPLSGWSLKYNMPPEKAVRLFVVIGQENRDEE